MESTFIGQLQIISFSFYGNVSVFHFSLGEFGRVIYMCALGKATYIALLEFF